MIRLVWIGGLVGVFSACGARPVPELVTEHPVTVSAAKPEKTCDLSETFIAWSPDAENWLAHYLANHPKDLFESLAENLDAGIACRLERALRARNRRDLRSLMGGWRREGMAEYSWPGSSHSIRCRYISAR